MTQLNADYQALASYRTTPPSISCAASCKAWAPR
jgi:hypothetical protein